VYHLANENYSILVLNTVVFMLNLIDMSAKYCSFYAELNRHVKCSSSKVITCQLTPLVG